MASYAKRAIQNGSSALIERMLEGARQRAIRRGIEFSITANDLPWVDTCPVLGVRLVSGIGGRGPSGDSPSIDRIDNSKGYVPGNVWVISHRANCIKHTSTVKELRAIIALKEKTEK